MTTKTKTSHTPGPWTVRNGHGSPQIVGPDYRPNVGMGPICRMDRDYIPAVEAANARLIAAAPELLEAVKLLQAALTEYQLRDVKKRYSLCVADAAASAAIARAEGR